MIGLPRTVAIACSATFLTAGLGHSAELWPFAVSASENGSSEALRDAEYTPLERAQNAWNLCVLYPHMQDSYWVSVNYGLIEQAKQMGVKVSAFQAGGYSALPRQVSQYDDCVASGADAILIAAVSEAGMAAKMREGMAEGIANVSVANPILETPITARVSADFYQKGFVTAQYASDLRGDEGGAAVAFPGPQGSGWAETYLSGFKEGLNGGDIELLAAQFGEASVPAQLRLVEDALQTFPDMNVIWGGAPTAESAVEAVADAGRDDIAIIASYENQTMLKAVRDGDVLAFATEYPVMMGRIAVDLAVRALEGKPLEKYVLVSPGLVTNDNIETFDTSTIFAPDGTQPEFSIR